MRRTFRPTRPTGSAAGPRPNFVTAVTKGVSPRGTHYFPAFPYTSYAHARIFGHQGSLRLSEDARAGVRQGARSRRAVPVQHPPQCRHLEIAVLRRRPFTPDMSRSPQWNRGAYLVNSLGHCAECHSPRNFLGGIIAAQRFAGGPNPEGEGWVPNITQKGIGDWSAKDIDYFLKTGQTPDGDSAGGSMVRVIKNTSQLPDADQRGDRRLCEIVAAGRRTAKAEEAGKGRRPGLTSLPTASPLPVSATAEADSAAQSESTRSSSNEPGPMATFQASRERPPYRSCSV